jgi:hypothetical protein
MNSPKNLHENWNFNLKVMRRDERQDAASTHRITSTHDKTILKIL